MRKGAFANSSTEKMKRENGRFCATSVKAEVDREDTFTQVLHRRRISTELKMRKSFFLEEEGLERIQMMTGR